MNILKAMANEIEQDQKSSKMQFKKMSARMSILHVVLLLILQMKC